MKAHQWKSSPSEFFLCVKAQLVTQSIKFFLSTQRIFILARILFPSIRPFSVLMHVQFNFCLQTRMNIQMNIMSKEEDEKKKKTNWIFSFCVYLCSLYFTLVYAFCISKLFVPDENFSPILSRKFKTFVAKKQSFYRLFIDYYHEFNMTIQTVTLKPLNF